MHQWLISVYVHDRVPDERDLPFWDQLVSRLETLASQLEVKHGEFFSQCSSCEKQEMPWWNPTFWCVFLSFPCHFEVKTIENPTLWWHFVSYRLSPGFPDFWRGWALGVGKWRFESLDFHWLRFKHTGFTCIFHRIYLLFDMKSLGFFVLDLLEGFFSTR